MQTQCNQETDGRQYTHDTRLSCSCCGRPASRFRPMILSDKGWVCVQDSFCRAGTSVGITRESLRGVSR